MLFRYSGAVSVFYILQTLTSGRLDGAKVG